ncbi:MAG: hypothetical protein MSC31_04750 [Solirubrobacteraceae bacterium MAG38_C4-C5]|nr:hypothetical protein [Candidatus Siliceabacter maunaloa]
MAADEAQVWCNFPVLVPRGLPPETTIVTQTLRPECCPGRPAGSAGSRSPWSEGNPSSYRFEIAGKGRKLRVKEFLYDWAPAAADQPCLWGGPTWAEPIHPDYVVWLGTDYMGHRGAYARIYRTSCELSVLAGTFSDEEIVTLYRTLEPVSPTHLALLGQQSFARLSYWARFRPRLVDPPHGLFRFRRPEDETYIWTDDQDVVGSWGMPRLDLQSPSGFRFDSAALFGSTGDAREVEVLFTSGEYRGREVRIVAQWAGCGRIDLPSRTEAHPCTFDTVIPNGDGVEVAFVDHRFGPHEAIWQDETRGVRGLLLTSAGPRMDRAWFEGVVTSVVAPP